MAGGSLYQDGDEDGAIADINVTPFVDVVLVLLVIFMVTARLIVARGVEVDKPVSGAGGPVEVSLRINVDKNGALFVNGERFDDKSAAIAKVKEVAATMREPKAAIAGDRMAAYDHVMKAIEIASAAGVAIALENTAPQPAPP